MQAYKVGDLVKPNPKHWSYDTDDDASAVGTIIQTRSMMHMRPEVKIMWSDSTGKPVWTVIDEVVPLELGSE